MKEKILLAMDPGQKNYGWAKMTLEGELISFGMVKNTLNNLKETEIYNEQRLKFVEEMNWIFEGVDELVLERFVPRGMHKGNLGECISIMVGHVGTRVPTELIMASSWKEWFAKRFEQPKQPKIRVHIRDAISIGLYYLCRHEHIDMLKIQKILGQIRDGKENSKLLMYTK